MITGPFQPAFRTPFVAGTAGVPPAPGSGPFQPASRTPFVMLAVAIACLAHPLCPAGEQDFRLSPTDLPKLPLSAFCDAPGIALAEKEGKIAIGAGSFGYRIEPTKLMLDTQGGAKVWKEIAGPGQSATFVWKEGTSERRCTVRLERGSDKVWRAVPITALAGTVGDTRIAILDWNLNGAYNDEMTDAVVIGDSSYAIPLEKVMYVGKNKVTWTIAPAGAGSKALVEPLPDSPVLPALLHLNMRRLAAGLPPRCLDEALCSACQAHAHYCAINKYFGHPEDAKKPGYTKEGHDLGGMNSIISSGRSAIGAVDGFLCTFLHRIDEIHPDTDGYGIGNEGAITSINGRTKRRSLKWSYPVLYPAPEMTDVPTRFENESPNPLPSGHNGPAGFPVTAMFAGGTKVTEATGELLAIGPNPPASESDPEKWPKGTAVDCYFTTPEKPACSMFGNNLQCICFIGKTALAANTVHVVRISYSCGGKKDSRVWWFKTGSSPGYGGGRRPR